MWEKGREEASYVDLKRLVRSVGNLPLAIDQAASDVNGYESSTSSFSIYIEAKKQWK